MKRLFHRYTFMERLFTTMEFTTATSSFGIYDRLPFDEQKPSYEGRSNVITFKDFFESDLAIKRKPIWLATGIPCAFGQAIE